MADQTQAPADGFAIASGRDPVANGATSENARDGARKRRDPNEPTAVIGIGASAGGIAPLQQFFGDLKPDTGLAFVVVMHLAPEHESQLASVIQHKTLMPVTQVTKPVRVRPNHVYVIPPHHQLTFEDSTLHLVAPQQEIGRRVTIDLFFRTLAHAYGQRAVCVIMSGTDSDGVIGLKHIRAQGGLTIVQDPNEAEFDSMPVSAISTGMADWILPVAEMPAKLLEFVRNEQAMRLPPEIADADEPDQKEKEAPGGETVSDETRASEDEEAIEKVLTHVCAQTGHDFSHYKRATVLRRIARRMQVNSIETIPQYVNFIRRHPAEGRALLQDLLIGVTHFFRDRDAFAALEAHIPQLFAGKRKDDEIRAWVAGCATGEEAYSVAMLLCEHAAKMDNPPAIQIFATDIDEEAIAEARIGIYAATIEADVSPERLRGFFARDHGRYRVRKEVREKVLFATHNLLSQAPFSRCDLICCRNLLIYLTAQAQRQVFDIFHFALRSGSLLFIGDAENYSHAQALFSPVDAKHRLFARRSTPRPSWRAAVIPQRAADLSKRKGASRRAGPMPPLTHDVADQVADAVALRAGQTRRETLFGELHLRLLEEYGPPSAVVNETHDIVHLSENAGRYLQFMAGEPTANITKVVVPALQIEMRTTLFKAAQTKSTAMGTPIYVDIGSGKSEVIRLEIRPMHSTDQAHGFFLVLFHQESETAQPAPPESIEPRAGITREADDEIQFLKEQLAATVEQHEASNEELKAANEELQAMNEEMRSATEELETSKEELQSVNEELTTVNYELKGNVEELSRTNADLNNLMASTDVGTIFLDRQLRIHRFTPAAQKIFNLIPSDLGRPLSDITNSLKYNGFMRDVEIVLEELTTIEHEVRVGEEGEWYLGRIAPYRTSEDRIAGVVATFINITRRKEAEGALRESEGRMKRLADALPQLIWTNEVGGKANYFNQRWYEYTGLTDDESRGPGWQQVVHPDDARGAIEVWKHSLKRGEPFEAEYRLRDKDGKYRWFIGRNLPLRDTEGRVVGWFGSATDIHELKRAEAARGETEERFRLLVEGAKDYAMFLLDPENTITFWSEGAERVLGWTAQEAIGQKGVIIFTPEDQQRGEVERELSISREKGRALDRRWHLRKDGSRLWLDGVMRRIDGPNGEIRGYAKIARDATNVREVEDQLRYARDEMEQRVLDRTADLMTINNELERAIQKRDELERDLLEISERERRRIGHDLHDLVCQELTATALFLKSVSNKIDNEEAAKSLQQAAAIVNRNVAVARDLARGFQPADLRAGGLIEALHGLCRQANEQPSIHCTMKLPKSVRVRDENFALNLYRIAQEAVRNAVMHSGGTEIVICIERERDVLRLVVEDNGKGFRPRRSSKGLGLQIMKYRANVLGGTLVIDPPPKGGTKVTCELPVKPRSRAKTAHSRR